MKKGSPPRKVCQYCGEKLTPQTRSKHYQAHDGARDWGAHGFPENASYGLLPWSKRPKRATK